MATATVPTTTDDQGGMTADFSAIIPADEKVSRWKRIAKNPDDTWDVWYETKPKTAVDILRDYVKDNKADFVDLYGKANAGTIHQDAADVNRLFEILCQAVKGLYIEELK
jgi:hypothetical protein